MYAYHEAFIKDGGGRLALVKICSRERGLANHSLSPEDNMITSLDETSAAIRRDSSAMSKAECQVRELLVNQISTETLDYFRFLVPPQLLLEAEDHIVFYPRDGSLDLIIH